jgi:hypothetical protein
MKTEPRDTNPGESAPVEAIPEPAAGCGNGSDEGIDLSLLDSLSKTPWERMQANDDALLFADLLRAAMEKRNAKPERTDPQTR